MSYEIYHKVKQLPNGDYLVTSKSSNCSCKPAEWTMDYFRMKYPSFTMPQRDAAFILYTLYFGARFYPAKYKRMQALARRFSDAYKESSLPSPCGGDNVWDAFLGDNLDRAQFIADQFIQYCKFNQYGKTVSTRIILGDGTYVKKFNNPNCKRILITNKKEGAQIFHETLAELLERMRRIPEKHSPQYEIVE